ncbi:MAG: DUF3618 domain-containing protein [Actinomycetaceae bacterium]|nr:DUF3618 domain-containing protein [Actinomycetaceae bacterium]
MSTQGTPESIEAQLAKMREELTGTVNELVDHFTVKGISSAAKDQAGQLLSDAVSGEKRAIAIVGGVALGALLVVGRILRH